MSNLSDEHNDDWLRALADDAEHVTQVLNRIESLGILAVEHLKVGDVRSALRKLADMGEGLRLVKKLIGLK